MSDKKTELDDFWDISRLVPSRKSPPKRETRAHSYDTEAERMILTASEKTSDGKTVRIDMRSDDNKLSFASAQSAPKKKTKELFDEYSPSTPFIDRVLIYKRTDFNYYAAFYLDGLKYLDEVGSSDEEDSDLPFFSYVPQYSQMNARQRNRYFCLRSCLRAGEAPSMPYSYLLLYIFELINIEPDSEKALDSLCFVWNAYEKSYPILASLMPEWITDYALIHKLMPKPELIESVADSAVLHAKLGEIFMPLGEEARNRELAQALIKKCSSYDYKKSKFATEDALPLYDKYIPLAIERIIDEFRDKKGFFVCANELKRPAFSGALCTPENKFEIEAKYCSVSRSYEMKFIITDAIKHIENRIRAYIGVKSRLTVYSLPVNVRECIDELLDRYISGKRTVKKEEEKREYDKLYELPKKEFSIDDAKEIEKSSWQTTKLLVEAFEESEDESVCAKKETEAEKRSPESAERLSEPEVMPEGDIKLALAEYIPFIKSALAGDLHGETEFALSCGKLLDTVADEINEIASDVLGDIILEKENDVYTVIPDYAEDF